ncbi:unnamed protein product [Eruca vesicaria subsp. sativa]|uniref:Transcription termination and cleavage factor C-terminal domain-containing protein n=1 Tax=Eruca vesicaria subsp. sativa TaxID=29727 RepID=A0ABC8KPU3_ERUVS|nr:unnamed protein product [Eruca vesicaria subsp. sativa]
MAGNQIVGDGVFPENLAGMTKTQLYGIMSQMKAQIMLGMVQPPQVVQKVETQVAPQPQQSHQPQKPNVQAHMSSLQGGVGFQEPAATLQPQALIRKHTLQQPMLMPPPPPPSASATSNAPSQQPRFSHPQRLNNPAATSLSHPQSSQAQNAPHPVPHHPTSQTPPFHHVETSASSTQLPQQQPMHSVVGPHLAQQQPRPYHHQFGPSQTGPNAGFQHRGAPPQHHSQPLFHASPELPASGGPQFPQGQPRPVSQPTYQGGGQFRKDYNNNQLGCPTAADRVPSWMAGQSESSNITHLPGFGPVPPPSQVGPGGGPPPRPAPISAEMEKALLQQVMSLTPEQINLLPPGQRNQVLQLQQILRQ